MKLALVIFCAGFFVFGFGAKASAATYYVDSNLPVTYCAGGSGTSYSIASRNCSASDGTKAYKTFKTALAGNNVAQGDTVYVRAGTYAETDTSLGIGAGSGSTTITPYNSESVVIDPGTLTNYMWLNPSYNLIIDGGANKTLTIQNSGASLKSLFYLAGGNTTITRTVITDPANRATNGWAQLDEGYGGGTLTMSRNLVHDMASILVFIGGGSGGFTVNLTANQMDTVHGIINVYGSGATLNEVNNTIVRSTGALHVVGQNLAVNTVNNIFALKTNGATNQLFSISAGSVPRSWNFKNNIVWRESITNYTDYSNMIIGQFINSMLDKSNRFINPDFTAYGTGYSNATLTLQNISTNYATGRGLNASLPSGGDYTGTAWPSNDNSIGCYINPTLNPNSYPTLNTSKVAFAGDSIMAGSSASDNAHTEWGQFSAISGLSTVNNAGGANDLAAITGQSIEGATFLIDRTIFEAAPKTAFISIGINDLAGTPLLTDNADRALGVRVIFDKLIDAGITPIWLGVESKIGNPPDNTVPLDFNSQVLTTCATYSMSCGAILSQMTSDANWKTDYYSDLTSNVHPNDAGHLLIARLAEYLYYTKSTIGTNNINIGAGARVYADGKFRDLGIANANTANLSVTPTGGIGAFNSSDKSYWLDITNLTWTNSGNHHKAWTESSSTLGSTQTLHTIGDLEANKNYNIQIDSNPAISNITGTNCSNIAGTEICQADSNGKITFTYTGGYSTHTFDVTEGDNTPPTTTASINSGTYITHQSVTLTCDDGSGVGCDKTYYTLTGVDPTTSSTIYSIPISIPDNATTVLKFFSTDKNANSETIKSKTYTVDTVAPDTLIDTQPNSTTASTSASFTFHATETSTFQCKLDSGSYASCTSPKNYTSLTEGAHTFLVQATDTATNVDPTPDAYTWSVDTTPPTITISNPTITPAQNKTITTSTSDGNLTMSNTTGTICDGSLTFITYADQTFDNEADNGKKVCYKAIDVTGNITYDLSNAIAGIDTTPPTLSFSDNVKTGPVQSDTITPTWGDATVKKWDYNSNTTCSTTSGDYSKTDTDSLNQTTETNNTKYICLYAEDALGNKTTLASANPINILLPVVDSSNNHKHKTHHKKPKPKTFQQKFTKKLTDTKKWFKKQGTTINRNLSLGSRGQDVGMLQTALQKLGLLKIKDTTYGVYKSLTKDAVTRLQQIKNIFPTGNFGSLTRNLLGW